MPPWLSLAFDGRGMSTLILTGSGPLSRLDSDVRHFGAFGTGFKEDLLVCRLAVNAVIMHNMTAILTMECWNNGLRSRDMIHEAVLFLGVRILL